MDTHSIYSNEPTDVFQVVYPKIEWPKIDGWMLRLLDDVGSACIEDRGTSIFCKNFSDVTSMVPGAWCLILIRPSQNQILLLPLQIVLCNPLPIAPKIIEIFM